MNKLDFFSQGEYLALPSFKKPKVMLNISSPEISILSFRLYNPFSKKARFLKGIFWVLTIRFVFFKKCLPCKSREKTPFLDYLEKELEMKLHSSIYYATASDKVVLQLVSKNDIIGYLKMPLNEIGKDRLLNELKALTILSEIELVEPAKYFSTFDGTPFLILNPIKGKIGDPDEDMVVKILDDFKQEKFYQLGEHPRIHQLRDRILKSDLLFLIDKLDHICANSIFPYRVVYEHGDFAPWNLMQTPSGIKPFDFEYFEEFGLEYMDFFKYYFQIGKLINGLKADKLLSFMLKKVQIREFHLILGIFLIKEIVRCKADGEPYKFELDILSLLIYK